MKEVAEKVVESGEEEPKKKRFWKNPKFPIVFALVFSGLIFSLSLFLVLIRRNGLTTASGGIPITITTEKQEYFVGIGERVFVVVENNSSDEVCFGGNPEYVSNKTYDLERKMSSGKYEKVPMELNDHSVVVGARLPAGEKTKLGTYPLSQNPEETAVYRLAIQVDLNCGNLAYEPELVLYSNDFTIERREGYDVVKRIKSNSGKDELKEDLDGDGHVEEVFVEMIKTQDGKTAYILHIGDKSLTTSFWTADFYIVDIDKADDYKEIVLHNPGPSHDDVGLYFWYDGQEIKEMGELSRWPKYFGNGKIEVGNWMGFWSKTDLYLLDNETHLLEWVPTRTYEVGIETVAMGAFNLYAEKSHDSELANKIYAGDEVKIVLADHCNLEDSYRCEWYRLEKNGVSGWATEDDFIFKLELTIAD